jgi:hypothetical protein
MIVRDGQSKALVPTGIPEWVEAQEPNMLEVEAGRSLQSMGQLLRSSGLVSSLPSLCDVIVERAFQVSARGSRHQVLVLPQQALLPGQKQDDSRQGQGGKQ